MDITFGIVTDGSSPENMEKVVSSINKLNITNYEILIVGDSEIFETNNTKKIYFDETIKVGWITKKKNLISQNAKYEIIVFLHDYYLFDLDWYKEMLNFGDNFDVCMNQITNIDGSRYHDWVLWVENNSFLDKYVEKSRVTLIPYKYKKFLKYMYVPGGYWIAKREFMIKNPLNEELVWGQAEDVEWSKRIRKLADYKINSKSILKILKHKPAKFKEPNQIQLVILNILRILDLIVRKN